MLKKISSTYDSLFELYGFWTDVLLTLAMVLLAIFGFLLVYRSFKKYLASHNSEVLPLLSKHIYKPGIYFIVVFALVMGNKLLEFERGLSNTTTQVLSIFLILALANLSMNIITGVKTFILFTYDLEKDDNLKARKINTQFKIIERLIKFLIILFAIGFVLTTFEEIRKVGVSLLASAGLAGVIIGFAAQKSIATIIAGIQIAFSQPIRLQDVVVVEGEWGRIEEITLTYVVVKIWDQRRLIVPITYFIDSPFQNWTRNNAELLGTVFLYTDYDVDINKMRKEVQEVVKNNENWDGRVAIVQVTNATEKSVELRVLVSSHDSPSLFDLRCNVREHLLMWLKDHYPQSLPVSRLELKTISDPTPSTSDAPA